MANQDRFEDEAMPHLRALYGTAYRLTRNAHDAEDLVQETLLRAFRGFSRFEAGTNVRAWLYTILFRARTDTFRRAGRSLKTVELVAEPAAAPVRDPLTSGGEEVARAVAGLPDTFRAAVLLRDVEDFSYEEIAGILSIPVGTVMSRIHRGRALLRTALAGARP